MDKEPRWHKALEANKEAHRDNLEKFGQYFREHASDIEDVGISLDVVHFTNQGLWGQSVNVRCEDKGDSLEVLLSTTHGLAYITLDKEKPELDSILLGDAILIFRQNV